MRKGVKRLEKRYQANKNTEKGIKERHNIIKLFVDKMYKARLTPKFSEL